MKITHNKVGQNINLVDGAKTDRAGDAKAKSSAVGIGKDLPDLNAKTSAATNVNVSDRAQEAKRIKDLAKRAPDVDMEKVEKFRKLIDSGNYKVDAKAVADKMVDSAIDDERLETEF